MSVRKRAPAQNIPSSLLSDQENNDLYNLLGRRCVTLATAVVQLYLAHPDISRWKKRCTGVCCFVKDNPKRSYFIRVYNIKSGQLIWEQELYNQFKYVSPRPYFHTFDTNDCRAGLNFADSEEANSFKRTISDKIQQKSERKARTKAPGPPSHRSPAHPAPNHPPASMHIQPAEVKTSSYQDDHSNKKSDKKNKKEKKKKGGKLTKADIGRPSDFKHVGHVGWDPNKGFDMNEVDPAVKDLFSSAGITESQLKDKETAKFIYDFIEKRGGVDAVKRESHRPPPPPTRGGNPPPPPPRKDGPPAPPSHMGGRSGPPPPPTRHSSGPPPPPPVRSTPQPPRIQAAAPPPSFPPSMGGAPPPPPPPPGPAMAPPPPPPGPMAPPGGGGGGGRGALLDQIRGGKDLRDAGDRPAPAPVASTGRGALLDQIRQGKALKTVTAEQQNEKAETEDDAGLAGALARALQQREKAIHTDSESDGENGFSDDDDWDD